MEINGTKADSNVEIKDVKGKNGNTRKMAIIATHPVQYNAPWFRLLSESSSLCIKVFYTWSQSNGGAKFDPGFRRIIEWDIPLLDGYDYNFVENTSKDPGSHHFYGIENPSLIQEVQAWNPDTLLVIGWSYKSHLSALRFFKGKIPVIFRGDSTLLDEKFGIKQLIRRVFLRAVYSNIDFALYVGSNNKKYFKVHGLKNKRLVYAPHAIDNDRFASNDQEQALKAAKWRAELGIGADKFVLLFAGKFEPKKNPGYMLELASLVKGDQYRFVLLGNGPLEQELKEKADGDPRIHFIDFQNQQVMPVVYRLADVFLLPSDGPGETWGLALNEAMACNRVVMASRFVGGAADLIQEGVNGFMIDKKEMSPAVLQINNLEKNRALTKEMGMSSGKIIRRFSFSILVHQIQLLVSSISLRKK
jgi:glycosyltransferase involved in cell wall biosynthesis